MNQVEESYLSRNDESYKESSYYGFQLSGLNKKPEFEIKDQPDMNNQKNYASVSLCCLTVTNPLREKFIRIVINPWFDRFILFIILANCVFLAIDDPNKTDGQYQVIADYIFLSIFTFEMILKIIAMGFAVQPYSYMRDAWNILDFIVVIMGWVNKIVSTNNISAIRVIRILRPLRTINSIPSMRQLVQALLNSLPTMLDVFILFMFFLIMFGTIATQLFGGLLLNRCVDSSGTVILNEDGNEVICNTIVSCDFGYKCVRKENPDFGVSSFDDILKSDLNIFIIITLEGWTNLMYYIRQATGTIAYDIFFILVVTIGSFFLINLMVAIQFSYLNVSFKEQNALNKLLESRKNQQHEQIQGDINKNDQLQVQQKGQKQEVSPKQLNFSLIDDKFEVDKILENEDENMNPLGKLQQDINPSPKKKKCDCFRRFRVRIFQLVSTKWFDIVVMALVVINSILMALDHYDMDLKMNQIINIGNSILTCFFGIEMILKLVGFGLKGYVLDGFNDFDAIIVIIGLLEFANVGSKAITVLRAFRLLRIFKLVRSWQSLRKLLQTVLASFSSIANLALLMCLLIFIYALIGMQFFSGNIKNSDESQFRYNFNGFWQSIITIFVLLTAENWNTILYEFILKDGWGASIYFVSMIIFGNIMLLNLFLAILLNFISEGLEDDDKAQIEQDTEESFMSQDKTNQEQSSLQNTMKFNLNSKQNSQKSNRTFTIEVNRMQMVEESKINDDVTIDNIRVNVDNQNNHKHNIQVMSFNYGNEFGDDSMEDDNKDNQVVKLPSEFKEQQNVIFEQDNNSSTDSQRFNSLKKHYSFRNKNTSNYLLQGRSLFIFKQNNKLRQFLKKLLEHPYFEGFIFHFIALMSLLLAIDQPVLIDPYQKKTIAFTTNVVSGLFIMEAVLKIILMGFALGPKTYMRDPWNSLDFIIVFFTCLNWLLDSFSNISVSFLRGYRALRALRPLRMVSKNEGMKIVVNSLLRSIPSLLNVVLVCILFLMVFGILGVQLFKGAMSYCTDSTIIYKSQCIGQYLYDGKIITRQWIVPFYNYNNVGYSMLTFFQVAAIESWPDVLFATIDSQGLDMGPKENNRPYVFALFVAFIFITTFFVMNLFISVIVDKFNDEIKKKEGSHKFTEEQKEWVKMQRIMLHVNLKIRPTVPKNNKCRKLFYKLVIHNKFEYFIIIVISLNTIFLCMDYTDKSETYDLVLYLGNLVFVIIFAIEAILKLIAFGPKYYFLENWNKFDFIIVVVSILALDESIFSVKVTALRIIRVTRLLRMVKASKGLRHLLKALWLSLVNIINVGMILFLVFFTFSVAGMDLFGNIQSGNIIDSNANFRTFYFTITTLFRSATGENWNGIMHDCFSNAGSIAIVYWLAFELVTHYIFLNVFIAVIYENFNDVKASENDSQVLSLRRKDIKAFVRTWSLFCPSGDKYMKTTNFPAFLQELPPPLGYGGASIETQKLNKIIFCLNIKNHLKDGEGKVYFPEVMWAMFHSIVGNNDEEVHNCEQVQNIMKQLRQKYKGLGKNITPDKLCGNYYSKKEMTVSKYLCARAIYRNWKILQHVRKLRREQQQLQSQQQSQQSPNKLPISSQTPIDQKTKDEEEKETSSYSQILGSHSGNAPSSDIEKSSFKKAMLKKAGTFKEDMFKQKLLEQQQDHKYLSDNGEETKLKEKEDNGYSNNNDLSSEKRKGQNLKINAEIELEEQQQNQVTEELSDISESLPSQTSRIKGLNDQEFGNKNNFSAIKGKKTKQKVISQNLQQIQNFDDDQLSKENVDNDYQEEEGEEEQEDEEYDELNSELIDEQLESLQENEGQYVNDRD